MLIERSGCWCLSSLLDGTDLLEIVTQHRPVARPELATQVGRVLTHEIQHARGRWVSSGCCELVLTQQAAKDLTGVVLHRQWARRRTKRNRLRIGSAVGA